MIEFREQRADEGVQSWRAGLIQTGGTDADLTWRLARVLINIGRIGEAQPLMAQYRRLAGGTEPNAEYRYLEALVNLRAGRAKEALATLEPMRDKLTRSTQLAPAQHLITLGDAYAAARDEARAIDTYAEAAKMAGVGSQPWMSIARIHQAADRPAEAIKALEDGLAAAPGDAGLLVALAQALRLRELVKPKERRDWAEFEGRLRQAEQAAGDTAEVALLRADYLADRGQLDDALKRIEAAVARAPRSAGPWIARVNALVRLGLADEALNVLDEAAKAAGDNATFRTARARLLLRRGEPRMAFEALSAGLASVPADQRPLLHRALGEFHQGRSDFKAARSEYDEWARLQPESIEPRLALLNLANAMQDGPGMEAQAEAIRKVVGPDAVIGKVARAEVLLNLKPRSPDGRSGEDKARLDEVEKLVAEIKAAAPRQASGSLLEARLMARLGRANEEIDAYKAALDLRGGQVALKPLVLLLVKARRDPELAEVRQKVANVPMDVDQLASAILLQQGDTARAEELVDQMITGNPEAFDAAVWKVKILNTLGKPREAEEVLRQLTLSQPKNPSTWVSLLMFQASRGEIAEARKTLETMKTRADSNRKELLWAACYRALGMRPEADEAFAAALKLWPDDPGVGQIAIDYYETTGRPELAEVALRHLMSIRPGLDWGRRRLALNLSARVNNPTALSEALNLLGPPGPAESPEDRQLRAVILSRSADPKHRAEAIGILEALTAEVVNPAKLHEALARSLLASSEQARVAGDMATADADRARGLGHAAKAAAGENAPADVILFNAVLRLQEKDIPGAQAGLARIEKTDPKALPTVELKARILHAEGKDPEAESLIRAAFAARKAAPDALASGVGLLKLLMALNRPEAAEALGAELAETGPRGRIAFAEFLAVRGKVQQAREQLELASKAGAVDEATRASLNLANDLGGGWVDQTERLLGLALKGKPESLELLQMQAYLRHVQRDYSAEINTYQDILAKNPSNLLFLNNMAWTLSEEMGRGQEGFEQVERAIAKVGRQSHLIDTRGVILLRLGRIPEAIKDLEDAAGMLPTGPIYYHLARAYKMAGRQADSEKYCGLARKAGLRPEQLQPSERDEAAKLIGLPAAKPAPGPDKPVAAADKPAADATKKP
jgi:tetratricopeptide (TPR) repeat protein